MDINSLRKKLQDLLAGGENAVATTVQHAAQGINYNFWHSPVGQGLVSLEKATPAYQQGGVNAFGKGFLNNNQGFANYVPQIQAPHYANPVQQTVANIETGAANLPIQFGTSLVSPIANLGFDLAHTLGNAATGHGAVNYNQLKSPISRLEYNVGGVQRTPQQVIGNIAGTGADLMNYALPGEGKQIAKDTFEMGAKNRALQQVGKEALSGGTFMGLMGLLQGLSEGRNSSPLDMAKQGVVGGLQGFGTGAALSGGVGAVGYGTGKANSALTKVLEKHNIRGTDAKAVISQFARDEAGRFTGKKIPMETPTPPGLANNMLGNTPDTSPVDTAMIPGKSSQYSPARGKLSTRTTVRVTPQLRREMRQALGIPDTINLPQPGLSIKMVDTPQSGSTNVSQYVKELSQRQEAARKNPTMAIPSRMGQFYQQLKTTLIDSNAPIEDALTRAEKQNKFQVRPTNDIRLQIDRVLRADSLAGQFAKDNGITDIIKKAPDLNALDQYMIAKQAADVNQYGKETGRNIEKDRALVQQLAPVYEPLAQAINQYSRKLLQYSVDSGLIDPEAAKFLVQKYPNYVPLNRIFNEMEQSGGGFGRKGVANLSKQTVVQKLVGSTRQIESPIASLLAKTQTAFDQGERNVAAAQLASYRNLPGFDGLIRELKSGETATHTFSYLDQGKKRTFATTPEIAAAAKALDKQQMNVLEKIISVPTRALRLGATGLNYPFALSNLVKDQSSAFINSHHTLGTSAPKAFLQGLFGAVGHGELYQEVVRNAAGGTSFDIGREQPHLAVAKIRASRNVIGKAGYTVRHPMELVRAVEDTIGRTEEATRIQQYKGAYDALIKQGRTPTDAKLLAAKAARENTTNFARGGNFSKVLNWVIPYFNAGVQGSRTFTRNVTTRPAQTITKFAIGVGMPVTAATLWNLSDPQRKQAYDDINEYEKQNSIIIVPPNPTKNADGSWNVIKIPLSQEIAQLSSVIRRPLEQAAGLDPVKVGEMANALFQTATSLNAGSPTSLASGLVPQAVKPLVEAQTNKNLFTGQDIVPEAFKNLPPEQQVKATTSGTARMIGKALTMSPLLVQNEANTMFGGLGPQLLNASDNALNKAGVIPDNQVSGKSVTNALDSRFLKATGGRQQTQLNAQLMQGLTPKETQAYELIHTPRMVDANGTTIPDNTALNSQKTAVLYLAYPKVQAIDAVQEQAQPNHDPIWDLPPTERNIVFGARTALPNQTNTYKKYLQTQPWYSQFEDAETAFFDSLPQTGGSVSDRPSPSTYVQQQMDAKNWKDPQVQAFLDANSAYNNQKLLSIGLPPVNSSYGSYAKKPKKVKLATIKVPKIKISLKAPKAFKPKKIKLAKVSKSKTLTLKPIKLS